MHIIIRLVVLLAMFLTLATPMSAQDVTGTWRASVDLNVGAGEPTFVFEQNDGEIKGTYTGTFGGANLQGTIVDDTIEFSFEVPMAGVATYTGKISGDTMKGTCDYGQIGDGTWEAKRVN